MLHNEGYAVTNYKSDPIGFLFMRFNTYEEMMRVMIQKYDDIRVLTENTDNR